MPMNLRRIPWMGVAALAALAAGTLAHQPDAEVMGQPADAATVRPANTAATPSSGTAAWTPGYGSAQSHSQPASSASQAEQFLSAVRGSSPLACEMIVRSVGLGWRWGRWSTVPDAERSVSDQVRWATERRDDPGIVPTLLPRVLPLHKVIAVDAYLPGCPPPADRIRRAVEALLEGAPERITGEDIRNG